MFGLCKKKKAAPKAKQIIPPSERADVIERIKTEGRQDMGFYRARFEAYQAELKTQLADMGIAHIVPVHYTDTVFLDPELNTFLLDMQMDPYLRWNTHYCTTDIQTAMITDCRLIPPTGHTEVSGIENPQSSEWDKIVLRPELRKTLSDGFDSQLREAAGLWQEAQERFLLDGDITTFASLRDYIRVTIAQISAGLERTAFPGQANMVHRLIDGKG